MLQILVEGFWSVPVVGGYIPSPRYFFAMSGNQNEMYGEILILGGKVHDNNIDQCIYLLHELNSSNGEAYDECNDNEKKKFSSYRDAMKNEKSTKNLQGIPTMNLEFNEAENIIID